MWESREGRKNDCQIATQWIEKGKQEDNFIYRVNAYFVTHQTFLACQSMPNVRVFPCFISIFKRKRKNSKRVYWWNCPPVNALCNVAPQQRSNECIRMQKGEGVQWWKFCWIFSKQLPLNNLKFRSFLLFFTPLRGYLHTLGLMAQFPRKDHFNPPPPPSWPLKRAMKFSCFLLLSHIWR